MKNCDGRNGLMDKEMWFLRIFSILASTWQAVDK